MTSHQPSACLKMLHPVEVTSLVTLVQLYLQPTQTSECLNEWLELQLHSKEMSHLLV